MTEISLEVNPIQELGPITVEIGIKGDKGEKGDKGDTGDKGDPGTYSVEISGSSAAPNSISAAGGITAPTTAEGLIFVQGDGGAVTVTADPPISDGVSDGCAVELVGTSDTNTVTLTNGTHLKLNGDIVLGLYAAIRLRYDATADLWWEVCRNEMPTL